MITLRPYQERAVEALLKNPRGIVHAPAGSGKTIIAAAALHRWLEDKSRFWPRVFWLANTQDQIQQALAALAKFPRIAQVADVIPGCYAGNYDCAHADLVILDECHHIAAPKLRQCLNGYTGPCWGFSATPHRADDLASDVFELIGPIIHAVDRAELIQCGNLSKARVIWHAPNEPGYLMLPIRNMARPLIKAVFKKMRFLAYRKARGDKARLKVELRAILKEVQRRVIWQCASSIGLLQNAKRNALIVDLARSHSFDSVLLLVGSIEYGQLLAAQIPGSDLVFSKIGAKKRRELINRFRSGDLGCLIATSLADEGLDVPRANILILASAGRSAIKIEQRTGRVLRAFAGKEHGIIYDFWDRQHFFLLAQSRARCRVYQQLGYQIETLNFNPTPADKELYQLAAA